MSTSTPTTDRTESTPTLTDGKWRAQSTETTPTRNATLQFRHDCNLRLYNLVDEENRVLL